MRLNKFDVSMHSLSSAEKIIKIACFLIKLWDEAFCINMQFFLQLTTKNADVNKKVFLYEHFFHHSKHFGLRNKCYKFQVKTFCGWDFS